jgi:hypothetical protein
MRFANILIPILLPLAVVGAYFAGAHNAKHDADILHKNMTEIATASDYSLSLMFVLKAIKSIEALQTDEAHDTLVQYTKVVSPQVENCSKSPLCSGWVISIPTKAQFEEIASLKERQLTIRPNTVK